MPFISGIGAPELVIILIVALIVVGPGRLPDVGAALGKSIREFRNAATEVKDATSLDPTIEAVPAAAIGPTPNVVPAAAGAPTGPPPLPEPAPVADEQPTRTA